MNSLCTPSRFDVSLSFRRLRGRHCPHSPLHSPLQEKILHLTQKKHPHPIDCSLVLSLELFMEDDPSLNVDEPPDIHECSTSVKVDASLLRFIDGKGGRTKKQIENDTATHLKIPSVREAKHGKCLVVKGTSQAKVDDAVSQIHRVLEDAAESPSLDYSHFISLPLALHSDLVVQVTRFHDSVMALLPAKDKLAESAGLSTEKSTNPKEETEDFGSEQFDGNHDKEMEVFETEQVADLGQQTCQIHNEIVACEHVQFADLGQTSTEKSTNLSEETDGSTSKQVTDLDKTSTENSTNQNKETEAFGSEQVADLGQTCTIHKEEIAAFEGEQAGVPVRSYTDSLLNNLHEQSKEEDAGTKYPGASKGLEDDAEIIRLPQKGHGIEESIFIKPATLHITVLMLKLWNKERVAAALDVLEGLKSKLLEALESRPVSVRLKGLECMKGSPAKAHVLYARVENADQENRLISACKVIKDAFIEAGLVSEKDKKQQFKLHATLMNTSYRKRRRGQRFGRRMPFDARPILSMHGSEEWGEYTITEAHLSERFVYDEDGYYHCCGSVKFPLSSALST